MNIIVISLERAKERRERITAQLKALNIDAVIMDAIDGKTLSEDELNKTIHLPRGWRFSEKFMPGEIGCTMSHIKALKIAKVKDWDNVIIFEDDITIAEDFEKRINLLLKMVPKNWEHIYLSGTPHFNSFFCYSFTQLIPSVRTDCLHSYMINKSAYDKIITKYKTFITTTDDMIIDMIFREKNLISYTYFPFVTHANSNYSYIWNKAAGHNIKNESKNYFANKIF